MDIFNSGLNQYQLSAVLFIGGFAILFGLVSWKYDSCYGKRKRRNEQGNEVAEGEEGVKDPISVQFMLLIAGTIVMILYLLLRIILYNFPDLTTDPRTYLIAGLSAVIGFSAFYGIIFAITGQVYVGGIDTYYMITNEERRKSYWKNHQENSKRLRWQIIINSFFLGLVIGAVFFTFILPCIDAIIKPAV
jgi:MFS family permease